jgi:hypothetical protein
LKKDAVLTAALGAPTTSRGTTVITSRRGAAVKLNSESAAHGGFDNDSKTLNSTLRIIRGSNKLLKEFPA